MTDKITELTPEQEKLLQEYADTWFKIGTSTDPTNRERVVELMKEGYQMVDKVAPNVVFCQSPFAATRAIQIWEPVSRALLEMTGVQVEGDEREEEFLAMRAEVASELAAFYVANYLGKNFESNRILNALGAFREDVDIERLKTIALDPETIDTPNGHYLWGCHDAYWIAYYRFCEELGVKYDDDATMRLHFLEKVAKEMMWWWPFDEAVFVCDRPQELHWEGEQLHNETGPALRFRDGWSIYVIDGIRIEPYIIENPELITAEKVRAENNIEVRRFMVERYPGGPGQYLSDINAEIVDTDQVPTDKNDPNAPYLMRALIRAENELYLVGTDGSTRRTYYMNLDPELDIKTCKQAHESIMPFETQEDSIKTQG
jgi:hypothetical protein